jgi:hypothetical protein
VTQASPLVRYFAPWACGAPNNHVQPAAPAVKRETEEDWGLGEVAIKACPAMVSGVALVLL